jgi:uncharacterized protein (TIGR03435 family)
MQRSRSTNAFAVWYVHYPNGVPEVFPSLRKYFDKEKPLSDWTDQAMFDQEVLGRSMPRLATFLSSARAQLEHTVIDHTGLSGAFTFKLEWTPDDKRSADTAGPSIITALQEQLGLKLETGKAPVEILVVDHAEKPSEN